jgi:ribosomal protein S18 acetylase RimI-like enzyme
MQISFQRVTGGSGLATVRRLADEIWPETFAPILPPPQIPYMMRMMYAPEVLARELADGVRWEIVLVDSSPSGYLSWSACPGRPGTAKLHKVYLASRWHGRGVGQAMLAHAADGCRAEGFRRVLLAVNKRNDRAIRAYRRNGFAVVESVCNDIGGGFVMDDFLMARELLLPS